MSHYDRDPSTGTLIRTDGGLNLQDMKAVMLELCYPIGSMYMSTVNVSPATFLGGTWISHSGYMLRGATSGVSSNQAQKDGGSDTHELTIAEMPSHTHTQNSHNHTQNAHNHSAQANGNHTHDVCSPANHTWGAWYGTPQGGTATFAFSPATVNNLIYGGQKLTAQLAGAHSHTIDNNTATNQAQTATNQNTGGGTANVKGAAHSVLNNYKNVYIWERTA